MQIQHPDLSKVTQKTRELCQVILDDSSFNRIKSRMALFLSDPKAQAEYDSLVEKGREFHRMQHEGTQPSSQETAAFEDRRKKFINSQIGRDFLDAQHEMNEIQEIIQSYIAKTFELGRVPTEEDFQEEGSCGSSCGCHGH